MGNTIPAQERSVDPFSSYDSNVVNKLTRIISDGNNVLLEPTPVDIIPVTGVTTQFQVVPGKAIVQDMLIEINGDIIGDVTDQDFYVDSTGGWNNEDGYYYVVLEYVYAKSATPNTASIQLIMPSQRTTVYDPTKHLFLKCFHVSSGLIDSIFYDYDPENLNVKRTYAGGGGSGSTELDIREISGGGTHIIDSSDTTVMVDSTAGATTLTLPLVDTVDNIIRIIKTSSDSNTITVNISGSDSIEGAASIVLTYQYDAVSLLPYQADDVWIEV